MAAGKMYLSARRKYAPKRRNRRRVARGRARYWGQNSPLNAIMAGNVYRFKRVSNAVTGIVGAGTTFNRTSSTFSNFTFTINNTALVAIPFLMGDVTNNSDFTDLFDQYQINYVVLHIDYVYTGTDKTNATAGSRVGLPRIYYVLDYDDVTAPATKSQLLEYQNCRSKIFTEDKPTLKIAFKPRPIVTGSSGTINYQMKKSPWIDINDTGMYYYGVKFAIEIPNDYSASHPEALFRVYTKYYMSFKGVR